MTMKKVTEQDFRKKEFIGAKTEDYEIRRDGVVVRKERWEIGIRRIAARITNHASEFEIQNLIDAVEYLLDQIPDRRTI